MDFCFIALFLNWHGMLLLFGRFPGLKKASEKRRRYQARPYYQKMDKYSFTWPILPY